MLKPSWASQVTETPRQWTAGERAHYHIIIWRGGFVGLTLPPGGGDLRSLRAPAGDDLAAAVLEIADTVKEITAG